MSTEAQEHAKIEQSMNGVVYQQSIASSKRIVGHSGFAWAYRADLLRKHGFYDRNIIGAGDVVMSWAMYGAAREWAQTAEGPVSEEVAAAVVALVAPILHLSTQEPAPANAG